MKYNKGFASLVVLLIVLGVLAVGGVAYFAGKSSAPKNEVANNSNYFPPAQQNYTPPTTNNNPPQQQTPPPANNQQQQTPPPTPTCNPSITVLSPNGGEVYTAGQQITLKWKSCGLSNDTDVSINLERNDLSMTGGFFPTAITPVSSKNTGSALVTLLPPSGYQAGNFQYQYGKIYKILLSASRPFNSGRPTEIIEAEDTSDNWFTINHAQVSTTLPQYIGGQNWPPVIQISSTAYSCNNIGVAPNTDGNDVTAQRVINGRTYCIHSLSDGYAGGRGYTYTYTTSNGSGTKTTTFTLLYQSCGVWQGDGTTKYTDCQTAQSTFNANLDNLIDSLM